MIRKLRCFILCYTCNLFLALDTLACQLIYNRYPWTLSSRETREGDESILSVDGKEMSILDRYLDWIGVKMPDPEYQWILEIPNHYRKWVELENIDRHYFRTDGKDIYYGEFLPVIDP